MSLAIELDLSGIDDLERHAAALVDWDRHELMDGIGRTLQEQARERIESTKEGPDGTAWPKSSGDSTLYASGALHDSIDYVSTQSETTVGSSLVYAAIHQFGGTIRPKNASRLVFTVGGRKVFAKKVTIPPRPYIGISDENRRDIVEDVEAFIRGKLAA
ncbi:MAG: phage virion morphogenesis protein [Paracoccaceae bacterium]